MSDSETWHRTVATVQHLLKRSTLTEARDVLNEAVACAQAGKIKGAIGKARSAESTRQLLAQLDTLALSHRAVQTSGIGPCVQGLVSYPDVKLGSLASTLLKTWEEQAPPEVPITKTQSEERSEKHSKRMREFKEEAAQDKRRKSIKSVEVRLSPGIRPRSTPHLARGVTDPRVHREQPRSKPPVDKKPGAKIPTIAVQLAKVFGDSDEDLKLATTLEASAAAKHQSGSLDYKDLLQVVYRSLKRNDKLRGAVRSGVIDPAVLVNMPKNEIANYK